VALIKNGEAIQVVLSQRFGVDYNGDPLNVYRALRTVNPSPYMHFLRMGDTAIVGASPELMVKVESGVITLRPIAGTAKRGKTAEEDAKFSEALLKDEKERAEHVMLVDLGRNDIGRVAQTGTVKVKDMMIIEKYSHVMHIVSSVEGKMKKGLNIFDVFKATFPAGTVSGAPKVRSMQIIDEMETIKRGPYAGAVGFISFTGDLLTCISIRTLYYNNGTFYAQAGAGIVADSKAGKEYNESMNKAMAVFRAIERSVDI
jgi:anthranilate synthase component I